MITANKYYKGDIETCGAVLVFIYEKVELKNSSNVCR